MLLLAHGYEKTLNYFFLLIMKYIVKISFLRLIKLLLRLFLWKNMNTDPGVRSF